ncbi:MAG: hypothetical protein HKN22_08115 [Bacteroidia bacterium]|nr:hypothetical protein [Bacteroidia bacterium]
MKDKFIHMIPSLIVFAATLWISLFIVKTVSFINIEIEIRVEQSTDIQIYYTYGKKGISEDRNITKSVPSSDEIKSYKFPIHDQKDLNMMRFDLGTKQNVVEIKSFKINGLFSSVEYDARQMLNLWEANDLVTKVEIVDDLLVCHTRGPDPFLTYVDCKELYVNEINRYWSKTVFIILAILLSLLLSLLFYARVPRWLAPFEQTYDLILVLVFIAGMLVPLSVFLLPGMQALGSFDNRALSPAPDLAEDPIFTIPEKFSEYFEDRFGFRNELIEMNNDLKAKLFNMSAIPNRVQIGKEGWLYFTGEGSMKDYILNRNPFTNKELEKIYQTLLLRSQWLEKQGIKYYIMIPPIKAHVYPEYLPPSLQGAKNKHRLDQVLEYLDSKDFKVPIIDLRELYKEKKKIRELYYKSDTHWNIYGAFLAYQELLKEIGMDFPQVAPYSEDDYKIVEGINKFSGDLADMLRLDDDQKRTDVYMHPLIPPRAERQKNEKKLFNHKFYDYKIVMELPDSSNNLKLLVYRDSYTNYLIPKIAEHFDRSVYIWSRTFNYNEVLEEQPDIVAEVMLERFIHEWIDGNFPKIKPED